MPLCIYVCACKYEWQTLFKGEIPKRALDGAPCPECGEMAKRDLAAEMREGPPMTIGASSSKSMAETLALAGRQREGKVYVKDANGKPQEVRTSKDIESWRAGNNMLGKPRRVEVHNPYTGKKEWALERKGGIKFDRETGEQLDTGPVLYESAKIVPLSGDAPKPPDTLPLKDGILANQLRDEEGRSLGLDPRAIRLRCPDPITGERPTLADCWGAEKDMPSRKSQDAAYRAMTGGK